MTTANPSYREDTLTEQPALLVRGARNGLVAGMAMAMVVMVLGIFDQGFFAAPSSIWAFWAGPGAYHPRDLDISFFLGAMGHMMNSIVLGAAFAFLATRALRPNSALLSTASGIAFALVVLAVMWFVVLPLGANGDIVKGSAAVWIWIVGHAVFGMVGGYLSRSWR